jgi:hypothetical protein
MAKKKTWWIASIILLALICGVSANQCIGNKGTCGGNQEQCSQTYMYYNGAHRQCAWVYNAVCGLNKSDGICLTETTTQEDVNNAITAWSEEKLTLREVLDLILAYSKNA